MTELNSVLLVLVVALLFLVSYLMDQNKKALERKIETLQWLLEDHVDSTTLHRNGCFTLKQ